MCGIIGVAGKIPSEQKFLRARDVLSHRGPDGAGSYFVPGECIALGHRRLSIIDLSRAGVQPMHSRDGRYILTFNGEIYNYLELREELKSCYSFITRTDTEVLLAAYVTWGADCLSRLNGMYAFAVWDRKERVLFAVRDRLGIKPFFYHHASDGTFSFSSEIKGLRSLGVSSSPNEAIIYEYLSCGFYDHSERTFFNNIKQLPAGYSLCWKEGRVQIKKYWDLADIEPQKFRSELDIRNKFTELLADSVRLQFRSDVPVGISLSSGMDSNGLLYFAEHQIVPAPQMVSVCPQSDSYNECTLIDASLSAAQHARWHTRNIEPAELFTRIEKMTAIEDQPYGGIPTLSWLMLYEQAREKGITVLLEGEGLDEILAGYPYYELDLAHDAQGIPFSTDVFQDSRAFLDRDVLSTEFVSAFADRRLNFPHPFVSALQNAQYRDIKYTKLPRVLRFKDHASMSVGRELRVPYLDHRLVEFCFFLPAQYKIRNGIHKMIARDVLGVYLPDIVRVRPKKIFGALQVEWLRNHYREEVLALLGSESFRNRGFWNYDKLLAKVNAFYCGEGDNSFFLWQCVNLELWFRMYVDLNTSKLPSEDKVLRVG